MITCVSERSGNASIAVDRTAQTPTPISVSTPIMTKKRFLTDQRMRWAITGPLPSPCVARLVHSVVDRTRTGPGRPSLSRARLSGL